MTVVSESCPRGCSLGEHQFRSVVERTVTARDYRGKRVLLLIPDGTRSVPLRDLFVALHDTIGSAASAFDVMVALGTHPPMSDAAIAARLGLSQSERDSRFRGVRFFNHAWDNPAELRQVGVLSADEIRGLTSGLFGMDVPVAVNRHLFDYDQIVILGPVFPHEVVGFSGGNKYLFPGVAGPEILNFFHWLGAVVTNPMIIGNTWTPVRRVVDRAASMVDVPKLCFSLVVDGEGVAGVFVASPEAAWAAACDLSRDRHVIRKERPFHTILSCAPVMYDDLWTGGKCMYKLEPVLADGGELIIYAPHIREISVTHGTTLLKVGYHCRDYFLKQWARFSNYPWGVLAHSTHVKGIGSFEDGFERPRAHVTLATGIPEAVCRQVNLGYRDPASLRKEDFAGREDQGVLLVPKAGEQLYQLTQPPEWAGGSPVAR